MKNENIIRKAARLAGRSGLFAGMFLAVALIANMPVAQATDHASHGDSASDQGKIVHVLKATYDNAQNPLSVDPVVTAKEFAIAGWVQGGQGGRALMRKKADGTWFIMLCSGDALKSAETLHKVGVPQDEAARLAAHLAEAEKSLPADRLAKFASFEGMVMVGESGHHAPHHPPQQQDGHRKH